MSFTVEDAEIFAGLIQDFGVQYTFTRQNKQPYDPTIGGTPAYDLTTYTAYAVKDNFMTATSNDTSSRSRTIKLIAESADYKLEDFVTIDNISYKITELNNVKPGDTTMIYELMVSKNG